MSCKSSKTNDSEAKKWIRLSSNPFIKIHFVEI